MTQRRHPDPWIDIEVYAILLIAILLLVLHLKGWI